jgi:uncharacterized protein (DUF924 family)
MSTPIAPQSVVVSIVPAEARAVLDFWFGPDDRQRAEWFRKDPDFDTHIRTRFGPLIDQALAGLLDAWAAAPESALARIVVLDQFTRNAFRDTPRAFAGDALALQAARELVTRGFDRHLPARWRGFAYLPFEHAEDLQAQGESLRLFAALADERPDLADLLTWARKHQEIVVRFGRYPHRNAILGRPSTDEERAFLAEPGSSF